jgi:hypothetical protein
MLMMLQFLRRFWSPHLFYVSWQIPLCMQRLQILQTLAVLSILVECVL